MAKAKDSGITAASSVEDESYHLTITYATKLFDGTHSVTVRDDYHDWADVEMAHTELNGRSVWTTDLVSSADDGPIRMEFKLVLDGGYWMSGWNQVGTTARPAAHLDYDDSTLQWETDAYAR
jgi:hypothetical protein